MKKIIPRYLYLLTLGCPTILTRVSLTLARCNITVKDKIPGYGWPEILKLVKDVQIFAVPIVLTPNLTVFTQSFEPNPLQIFLE